MLKFNMTIMLAIMLKFNMIIIQTIMLKFKLSLQVQDRASRRLPGTQVYDEILNIRSLSLYYKFNLIIMVAIMLKFNMTIMLAIQLKFKMMVRLEGPQYTHTHTQGPTTSPTPHYKCKAPLQVQSRKGSCLNWKGPKALSSQYKSKAPLQLQSPRGGCLNWKGPKAPSPQYKSKAPLQAQGPTTSPRPH